MSIKHKLRKSLWRVGYDISRFTPTSHPLARRKRILNYYNVDTVLDVGANSGQFSRQLRDDLGYENRIISFEPLRLAFASLETNAEADSNWDVFNIALGDIDEKSVINISENSYSSSLLDILPSCLISAPDSKYIGREEIEVKRLDSIFNDLCESSEKIYMKIDTQGYERMVLKGAEKSLTQIDTVQIEMSLVPLYKGELLFNDMCMLLNKNGYNLIGIETGFSNPESGQLLQVDGIFHRL